jgi:hypothetical protein
VEIGASSCRLRRVKDHAGGALGHGRRWAAAVLGMCADAATEAEDGTTARDELPPAAATRSVWQPFVW